MFRSHGIWDLGYLCTGMHRYFKNCHNTRILTVIYSSIQCRDISDSEILTLTHNILHNTIRLCVSLAHFQTLRDVLKQLYNTLNADDFWEKCHSKDGMSLAAEKPVGKAEHICSKLFAKMGWNSSGLVNICNLKRNTLNDGLMTNSKGIKLKENSLWGHNLLLALLEMTRNSKGIIFAFFSTNQLNPSQKNFSKLAQLLNARSKCVYSTFQALHVLD